MRIAVINETSSADRNADVVGALEGRGHQIVNCGMRACGASPEIGYIQTGFISAVLLALGRVDFVVGGCGTGQGYLNSALQYPGVRCGLVRSPLDAFLFSRINDGNCLSLALNEGYGWAGNVNLRFVFDALLSSSPGAGYPETRAEPQRAARSLLGQVSSAARLDMASIVERLPDAVAAPALAFPGIRELVLDGPASDEKLLSALEGRMAK